MPTTTDDSPSSAALTPITRPREGPGSDTVYALYYAPPASEVGPERDPSLVRLFWTPERADEFMTIYGNTSHDVEDGIEYRNAAGEATHYLTRMSVEG